MSYQFLSILSALFIFNPHASHAAQLPQCSPSWRGIPPIDMTNEIIRRTLVDHTLPTEMHGTFVGTSVSTGVGGRGQWIDLAMLVKLDKSGMIEFKMCSGDPKPDNRDAFWDFKQQNYTIDPNGEITLTLTGKAAKLKHWTLDLHAYQVKLVARWNPKDPSRVLITANQRTKGLFRSHTETYPAPDFKLSRWE